VVILNYLVDKGMCVNLTNAEGSTPLHLSALHDNLEATIFLVERGVSLSNTNTYGEIPLRLAANSGSSEVASYLNLMVDESDFQQERHCFSHCCSLL